MKRYQGNGKKSTVWGMKVFTFRICLGNDKWFLLDYKYLDIEKMFTYPLFPERCGFHLKIFIVNHISFEYFLSDRYEIIATEPLLR